MNLPQENAWIPDGEATPLHVAVAENNIALIKALLSAGCDLNAKATDGCTALLIATKCLHFEVIKLLLDAGADVQVTDTLIHKTALGILVKKIRLRRQYPFALLSGRPIILLRFPPQPIENTIMHFVLALKKRNFDTETLTIYLIAADCPFEYVLYMDNTQVTREFLRRNPAQNYENGMKFAMINRNLETVRLMLQFNHKEAFYKVLSAECRAMCMAHESWIANLELWPPGDIISEGALSSLDYIYRAAEIDYLQILFDWKIDEQVREKFGVDLRTSLFGHRQIDAIELLKNQDFDVNAIGVRYRSALHYAMISHSVKNVSFLLDSGADINAKDYRGRSALFSCIQYQSTDCAQVLLERGAEWQVVDDNGLKLFEHAQKENSMVLEFLIAQHALDREQGVPSKQDLSKHLNSNNRTNVEICSENLQLMKTYQFKESTVTLFALLTEKINNLSRHPWSQDSFFQLENYRNQIKIRSFYYSTMLNKLKKSFKFYRFKCHFSHVITESTGKIVDIDHLIIHKFSEYVNERDVDNFLSSVNDLS